MDAGAVEVRLLSLILLALQGGRGPCEPKAVQGALSKAVQGALPGRGAWGMGQATVEAPEAQCLCASSPLSTRLETHQSSLMSYHCPQALLSSLVFHLNTSSQAVPSTLPNSYTSLKGKP